MIDTVGRVARHDMLIRVKCGHCRHVGHSRADDVARMAGHGRVIDSLHFVCSRCNARAAKALPIEYDRNRPPKVKVLVPIEFRR